MRVLGIDPGLTRCGVGAVDGSAGRALHLVSVEVVRTPTDGDLPARLLALERALTAAVAAVAPDVVAVERVFSQHNVRTVMGTAQAAAVAVLVASRHGIPVATHTPSEVKAAVTGSGRAGKDQVAAMVTRLLALPERPRPADAADALALAICHLWRGEATRRLERAASAAPAARIPVRPRRRAAATQSRLAVAGPAVPRRAGPRPPSGPVAAAVPVPDAAVERDRP